MPPPDNAELPLRVQLASVAVPRLFRPPPVSVTFPPVIVSPERATDAPASMANTRLALLRLTVTPAAGPLIVLFAASLSSSWPPVRVIDCGALNAVLSKAIVSAPGVDFDCETAQRR